MPKKISIARLKKFTPRPFIMILISLPLSPADCCRGRIADRLYQQIHHHRDVTVTVCCPTVNCSYLFLNSDGQRNSNPGHSPTSPFECASPTLIRTSDPLYSTMQSCAVP